MRLARELYHCAWSDMPLRPCLPSETMSPPVYLRPEPQPQRHHFKGQNFTTHHHRARGCFSNPPPMPADPAGRRYRTDRLEGFGSFVPRDGQQSGPELVDRNRREARFAVKTLHQEGVQDKPRPNSRWLGSRRRGTDRAVLMELAKMQADGQHRRVSSTKGFYNDDKFSLC
eukprot:TRINITY_DN7350_c0_g1_i5.p1 TRINITY_DN7350_c0_g1~~TRINITY_DN7350_c0_g1_i5.p1  ORF type:complete len:171 (-),score=13.49 TRINITY_DN7350_c0_g1_i5:403-915(-)